MNLREHPLPKLIIEGLVVHHGTSVGLVPTEATYEVADPLTVGMAPWTGTNEITPSTVAGGQFFCKLFELDDGSPPSPTRAPRFFGVGFRFGVTDISCVNVFCHPEPVPERGFFDSQYVSFKGGWTSLFRFVEQFSRQMVPGNTNMVVIVPMFSTAAWLSSTTIFSANWHSVINMLLVEVQKIAWPDPPGAPPMVRNQNALTDVILSDFSAGRLLLNRVRSARGLEDFLREIWDFDGQKTAPPSFPSKHGNVIRYHQHFDQHEVNVFSVPFPVWAKFAFFPKLVPLNQKQRQEQIHPVIPATLFFHAATKSALGH